MLCDDNIECIVGLMEFHPSLHFYLLALQEFVADGVIKGLHDYLAKKFWLLSACIYYRLVCPFHFLFVFPDSYIKETNFLISQIAPSVICTVLFSIALDNFCCEYHWQSSTLKLVIKVTVLSLSYFKCGAIGDLVSWISQLYHSLVDNLEMSVWKVYTQICCTGFIYKQQLHLNFMNQILLLTHLLQWKSVQFWAEDNTIQELPPENSWLVQFFLYSQLSGLISRKSKVYSLIVYAHGSLDLASEKQSNLGSS